MRDPVPNIAFKEWAVVVDALARGEQILILRKGGIHEERGEFRVEHRQFWLFPTQFHEAETSVIPSVRPRLRELAAAARPDSVAIQHFATVTHVHALTDLADLTRLQGRHIWSEHILRQRFEFGRAPGLHALLVRVASLPVPVTCPLRETYAGCRSWLELESAPATTGLQPVLTDDAYRAETTALTEVLTPHALTHL